MPINEDIKVSTFEVIPEGVYRCEVSDVSIVEGKKFQSDEMEKKIEFSFMVMEGEHSGDVIKRRTTFKYVGGAKESTLFTIVKAIAGTTVLSDGINTAFLNSLIGASINVIVKHTTDSQGRLWANADTFLKATPATPAPQAVAAAATPAAEVEATPEYPAI